MTAAVIFDPVKYAWQSLNGRKPFPKELGVPIGGLRCANETNRFDWQKNFVINHELKEKPKV